MRGAIIARGVLAATVAAGPLFVLAVWTAAAQSGVVAWSDLRGAGAAGVVAAMLFAVPFGMALGIIPNLAGAAALAALGRRNDGVRLPVFWALIGAGLGGLADGTIVATGGTTGFVPLFTPVCLACALLCRAGTRWID